MSITHCKTCESLLDTDGSCPKCLMIVGLDSELLAGELLPLEIAEDRIPGYRITGTIGRGGMGSVFAAQHLHLDREVAIKLLAPEGVAGQGFADRFRREARTMASLAHPNIVAIHDFGEDGELYWLVMERVDGVNLRELMTEGLTSEQATDIVRQVCDALHYAHQQGVVHRDVKPENILVDRTGRVKLGDFGLAKLLHQGSVATRLTGSRHVMGTPLYMAPEQVNTPLEVDHRADIYALGVVLYELLTGSLPVGRFEPPSVNGRADARLDAVVLKALEHTPDRRYQQISEIRQDLDGALHELEPSKPEPRGAPAAMSASPGLEAAPWTPLASSSPEGDASPLWVRWWEIPVSAIAAIACFVPWPDRIRGIVHDDGSGMPDPWAQFAGVFLLAPVIMMAIGQGKIRRPMPWATLTASSMAFFMAMGACLSRVSWSPGPAPLIAIPLIIVVFVASLVRVVHRTERFRTAVLTLFIWLWTPFRSARGRIQLIIALVLVIATPSITGTWDRRGDGYW